MNKIILIGCLVQNPKVVASEGKKTAAYFRVAVNRKYGQEGDQNADYFSCVTFGTKAEFLGKYFQKGKRIALEGEMYNDNYTNDRGEKVYGMRLIVSDIEFADSKGEGESQRAYRSQRFLTVIKKQQFECYRRSIRGALIRIRLITKTVIRIRQTGPETEPRMHSLHANIRKTVIVWMSSS